MNNIKNTLAIIAFFTNGLALFAQDTYDAARFSQSDLNGTARYVGMGGALSALGGDISVMGTNPAGTAMFRKNEASVTFGAVMTSDGALGHDATRMSIDNAGIVFATRYGSANDPGLRFVNFGVNYKKNTNFLGNLKTGIDHLDGGFSQTWQIVDLAYEALDANDWNGFLVDMAVPYYYDKNNNIKRGGIIQGIITEDQLAFTGVIGEGKIGEDENGKDILGYFGIGADKAEYHRATYGSNAQVDANLSFNVGDKYFFGVSVGAYSIDYTRESFYTELGVDGNYYDFSNWYETRGEGYDLKFGFICRPFDYSPFRFGISIHTPTWYDLEDANGSTLYYNDEYVYSLQTDPFTYSYRTPWKFGLSTGYTIGNYIAIGAEYEFSDPSTAKYSSNGWDEDVYFRNINTITKESLKAQSSIKLGLEVKPSDELSVRVGYNYISSPFEKDAYRTLRFNSPFTETDFTNWGDTNRFTFGLGFRFKGGYIDMAYQYTAQEGDFYAFDDIDLKPTKIENNRNQLLCTLGLRF